MNNMNVLEKILEEIIDELKEEGIIIDDEKGNRAVEIIRSHINDVTDTNVGSKSGWTPCSERLPEETGYYLVQLSRKLPNEDYADRVVALYNAEEKEFMCYKKLIKAWQPLPESYKGGKESE